MKNNRSLRMIAIVLLLLQLFIVVGCGRNGKTTDKPTETITLTPSSNETDVVSSMDSSAEESADESTEGEKPLATIFAVSDFQSTSGTDTVLTSLNGLAATAVANGHRDVDLTILAGDYGVGLTTPKDRIEKIDKAFDYRGWKDADHIFLQGNHDTAHPGTDGLYGFEPYEHEHFSVYPIHEDMYMHYGNDPYSVKKTAKDLTDYLEKKLEEKYSKPIVVVSHLPLHYSMRVKEGDCKDAMLLFDPLNRAAANGLNIIFIFGHNHSNGWDAYLGNGSIFLPAGDSMYVNNPDHPSRVRSYKLNFTYMNAGYCGYITGGNEGNTSDYTLTASVLEIYEDKVVFNRYNHKGLHNLKSAGDLNTEKDDASMRIVANTDVYASPQTMMLKKDQKPLGTVTISGKELVKLNGNVTLTAKTENFSEKPTFEWKSTASYVEVTPDGTSLRVKGVKEGTADIKLTVTAGDEKVTTWYSVTVVKNMANVYKRVMSPEDLVDGESYIIVSGESVLTIKYAERADAEGIYFGGLVFEDDVDHVGKPYIEGKYGLNKFTFQKTEGGWLLKGREGYLTVIPFVSELGNSGKSYAAIMSENGSVFTFHGTGKPVLTTMLEEERMTLYHKSLGLLTAKDDDGNYTFYIYQEL